jgi:hypothetical protein
VADDGSTYSRDNQVDLEISGTDTLSEIAEMIISESPNFTGADWQDYDTSKTLTLSAGDGIKAIYIRYRDSDGNLSPIFVDYIIVDTIMNLTLDDVGDDDWAEEESIVTEDATPTFQGTAEAESTVIISIHSDPITTEIEVDDTGQWSWTPESDLAAGEHTVTITGTDLAGNSSEISFALTVQAAATEETEEEIEEEEETTEEITEETSQETTEETTEETLSETGQDKDIYNLIGFVFILSGLVCFRIAKP